MSGQQCSSNGRDVHYRLLVKKTFYEPLSSQKLYGITCALACSLFPTGALAGFKALLSPNDNEGNVSAQCSWVWLAVDPLQTQVTVLSLPRLAAFVVMNPHTMCLWPGGPNQRNALYIQHKYLSQPFQCWTVALFLLFPWHLWSICIIYIKHLPLWQKQGDDSFNFIYCEQCISKLHRERDCMNELKGNR